MSYDHFNNKHPTQDIQFKILKERTDKLNEDVQEERRIRQELDQEMER